MGCGLRLRRWLLTLWKHANGDRVRFDIAALGIPCIGSGNLDCIFAGLIEFVEAA